jgi:hypothetical protein
VATQKVDVNLRKAKDLQFALISACRRSDRAADRRRLFIPAEAIRRSYQLKAKS